MALPASGVISINDVNTEFALGQNLNSYRGQLYGTTSGTAGAFSSGTINLSDFYSKQKVTAGGPTGLSAGSYTVPIYRTITFTVTGGSGGGAGANGVYYNGGPLNGAGTSGSAGGSGGASSVGSYVSGAGGGPGGAGTTTPVTLTNPAIGGTGPASGSTVTVTIGGGGAGGSGGPLYAWNGSFYVYVGNASSGANGSSGSASVSWTA